LYLIDDGTASARRAEAAGMIPISGREGIACGRILPGFAHHQGEVTDFEKESGS
jgi:hypothetical protein